MNNKFIRTIRQEKDTRKENIYETQIRDNNEIDAK